MDDPIHSFLAERVAIETSAKAIVDQLVNDLACSSDFLQEIEQRTDQTFNAQSDLFNICEAMQTQADACAYHTTKIQTCPIFDTFSTTTAIVGKRGEIPTKCRTNSTLLCKYIQGQCRRFSRSTILKKEREKYLAEQRTMICASRAESKQIQINNLIEVHLDNLSRSDHQPVRCTLQTTTMLKEKQKPKPFIVTGWNIQEFVKDGLTTYISHMPSIIGSKGKGVSRMVMEAMLSPKVRNHHVQRVIGVVRRELDNDNGASIMCLQECDSDVIAALKSETEYKVHVCQSQDNTSRQVLGKCSSTTCIVVGPEMEIVRALKDVIVKTVGKGETRYTRRYARVEVRRKMAHADGDKDGDKDNEDDGGGDDKNNREANDATSSTIAVLEIVSVHVRHDTTRKTASAAHMKMKMKMSALNENSSVCNSVGETKTKNSTHDYQNEEKQRPIDSVNTVDTVNTVESGINAINIREAMNVIRASFMDSTNTRITSTENNHRMVVAVGDWNGPHSRAPFEKTLTEKSMPWSFQLSPIHPTQFGNEYSVDGIAVMTNFKEQVLLECTVLPQ